MGLVPGQARKWLERTEQYGEVERVSGRPVEFSFEREVASVNQSETRQDRVRGASLVRPSRDGDQFHYLWAARRCLLLLSPEQGLKSAWDRSGDEPKQIKRRAVRDTIAEYVAAFANADGGLLLIGVEDDGSPTGHGYPDDVIEEFVTVPRRRLRPPVSCRTGRLEVAGVELIAFNVPIAPEAVMVGGNGFPYRLGGNVTREPQEVINERKQAYRRVGYEQRFRAEARLDDLDLELAKAFLERTPVGTRPVTEALRYYGLIDQAERDWRVTNAALLLFAKAPAL